VLERFMPRIAAAKNDVEYGRILEEVVALLPSLCTEFE